MAKVTQIPRVEISITFTVNESEARALEAMASYGPDAFIKAFYAGCGRSYMEPHEGGMRSFLESITAAVNPGLRKIDAARKAIFDTEKQST